MFNRLQFSIFLATLGVQTLIGAEAATGKDFFLTIGGGYDPTGNQVSLEKNVQFLQSVLAEKRPDGPPHEIYFADGDDAAADVHYRDPEFEKTCPPARRMMAELFGDADSMDYVYRSHEIKSTNGPAERALLDDRLRKLAQELQPGDRLIVYATGHGGAAVNPGRGGRRRGMGGGRGRGNPYNTTLYLWNDQRVSASEFTDWLNQISPQVTTVLVMVQCHSGGFANTIFNEASAASGIVPHARCGFFSQVYDRAAAGCTPDVDEADYQEYSSFFWAALVGHTRAGAPLAGVDFDNSGSVSFAEAHAYAVLASDTIDIPVRMSEAILREFSRARGSTAGQPPAPVGGRGRGGRGRGRGFGADSGEGVRGAAEPASPVAAQPQDDPPAGLLPLAGPLARLAELARPEERAILQQLPARLGFRPGANVEDVRRRLGEVEGEIERAGGRLAEASDRYTTALAAVREDIRRIWPELNADLTPTAMALASERADEFVSRVSALPSYREFTRAKAEQERATDARLDIERTEAKLQRLLRTCEYVILAANLPKIATPEIVARYEQIIALEAGTLAASR